MSTIDRIKWRVEDDLCLLWAVAKSHKTVASGKLPRINLSLKQCYQSSVTQIQLLKVDIKCLQWNPDSFKFPFSPLPYIWKCGIGLFSLLGLSIESVYSKYRCSTRASSLGRYSRVSLHQASMPQESLVPGETQLGSICQYKLVDDMVRSCQSALIYCWISAGAQFQEFQKL